MGVVVLFASTSGIAQSIAEVFLSRKQNILLVARNPDKLQKQAQDLQVKFDVKVPTMTWDLLDLEGHAKKAEALFDQYEVEGLVMAAGIMPPQEESEKDPATAIRTIQSNFTAVCVILNLFTEYFVEKGDGFISCLSSVAGDRGRGSNYVYGASKAGLTAYLGGMRNRLYKHGILVQTVKPGPVKTAMTAHLPNFSKMAEPHAVAEDIVNGIERKREIVYTPFIWRYIMTVIRVMPEFIFKRLSL